MPEHTQYCISGLSSPLSRWFHSETRRTRRRNIELSPPHRLRVTFPANRLRALHSFGRSHDLVNPATYGTSRNRLRAAHSFGRLPDYQLPELRQEDGRRNRLRAAHSIRTCLGEYDIRDGKRSQSPSSGALIRTGLSHDLCGSRPLLSQSPSSGALIRTVFEGPFGTPCRGAVAIAFERRTHSDGLVFVSFVAGFMVSRNRLRAAHSFGLRIKKRLQTRANRKCRNRLRAAHSFGLCPF
jgi:hypothetical protein